MTKTKRCFAVVGVIAPSDGPLQAAQRRKKFFAAFFQKSSAFVLPRS
jgi:hypothetical protein